MEYRKRKMVQRAVAALLSFMMIITILPLPVMADETKKKIIVYVTDIDGERIGRATLSFKCEGEVPINATTDNETDEISGREKGRYVVELTDGKVWTCKAGYVGYEEKTVEIDLTSDINTITIMLLKPATTQKVTGTVADEEGNRLGGVSIRLEGPEIDSGNLIYDAFTDANGEFDLGDVIDNYGDYKVFISKEGYASFEGNFDFNITDYKITKLLDDETFTFENSDETIEIPYNTDTFQNRAKTEQLRNGTISYESSDITIATVDENGIISPVGIGQTVISATIPADNIYAEKTISYVLNIEKCTQDEFKFEKSVSSIIFGDEFTNIAAGGTGDGVITYQSDNIAVAEVDSMTGALLIKQVGTVKITATKAGNEFYKDAEASYTLIITKAQQEGIEFQVAAPQDINYSNNLVFNNKIIRGGSGTGGITYKISASDPAGVAEINERTGKLTINKPGLIEVTATKEGDTLYEPVSASYTLTINKMQQTTPLKFVMSNPGNILYGTTGFKNRASGGNGTGQITYASGDTSVAEVDGEGVLTIKKAGTVTITATKAEDDFYTSQSAHYTIVIEKAESKILFENGNPSDITFDNLPFTYEVKRVKGDGDITYHSDNPDIATVDNRGRLTVRKAGTVTITAHIAETDCYNEAEASYTITINRGTQTISFKKGNRVNQVYDPDNSVFANPAESDKGSTSFIYSIVSLADGADWSEFNENTGELTIRSAGIFKIKVKVEEDDRYKSAEAEYILIVEKAEQSIQFSQESYALKYGKNFEIAPKAAESSRYSGTGEITYSIVEGNDIAIIDESTGELTFCDNKTGEVTVKAVKASDNSYKEAVAEYKLTVSFIDVRIEDACIPEGEIKNAGGWFTGNVSIAAKEGYQLSVSNSLESLNVWSDRMEDVVVEDGVSQISFYVKTQDGISDKLTVEIKKDETRPDASIKVNDKSVWDSLLTILTFGIYDDKKAEVSIKGADGTSGVSTIQYYCPSGPDMLTIEELENISEDLWVVLDKNREENNSFKADFTIDEDAVFVVYAKVTDEAGNYVYASTNGIIYDTKAPDINIISESEIVNNEYYNDDVKLRVEVTEPAPYSGISSIEYKVVCDDGLDTKRVTQEGTLYVFEHQQEELSYGVLESTWTGSITIDAELNDNDQVAVYVTAVDKAGNRREKKSDVFNIVSTKPEITVTFDNNNSNRLDGDRGYYSADRTATVAIRARSSAFNGQKAKAGIKITAKDSNGNNLPLSDMISEEWQSAEGDRPGIKIYTATVKFSVDANYTFSVGYMDNANNMNKDVQYGDSRTPNIFTIDKGKPQGSITISSLRTWDNVLTDILTFGLWTRNKVTVSGTFSDAISPIDKVYYYKTSDTNAKTIGELEQVTDWKVFNIFEVGPNEKFTVYAKIIDYAGNVRYIGSNGVILDDVPANIQISPQHTGTGIYNDNVMVNVHVEEPNVDGAYSGIKEITYKVYNLGRETQSGTLYTFNNDAPKLNELALNWSGNIMVDKNLNNSNDVEIVVYAADNAQNASTKSERIKIDTTAPKIRVEYNNNDGDTSFGDGVYFKSARTATIMITERNFDANDVKINITNSDGALPVISPFTTAAGSGNGDDTIHVAEITYSADGDYTFDISYTDRAGNAVLSPVDYGNSLAPAVFTIDRTIPEIRVMYDNNSAANGNYYKADRTAAIIVNEHNFDTSRLSVTVNATDDGVPVPAPGVGDWRSDGDNHRAEIVFNSDALYTLDISYTDKAGNQANLFNTETFYVDKTLPSVSIRGIADCSANNSNGNIGFVLECMDTNIDVFQPVLTTVQRDGDSYITKNIEGNIETIKNGYIFSVANLELDGIYTLKCTVTDKAGNTYNTVSLVDKDGNPYMENKSPDESLIAFSVNREGSVFRPGEYTSSLTNQYYVQRVNNDIVITEANADPLQNYVVLLNGKELKEGTDYTMMKEGGEGQWCKYTYTISRDLFESEGEYSIIIESVDKTQARAYSDVKNLNVSFVVDRTAPIVTISGIKNNGRYRVTEQKVTAIPTDDGGKLYSFKVFVFDSDGNPLKDAQGRDISVRFDLTGEDLENYLKENGGIITFTIPEGLENQVQIICNDCAVDENGDTNEYNIVFKKVTVSPSRWIIFYANKSLFYFTVAGILVLLTGTILLILFFKRRNKNEKENRV